MIVIQLLKRKRVVLSVLVFATFGINLICSFVRSRPPVFDLRYRDVVLVQTRNPITERPKRLVLSTAAAFRSRFDIGLVLQVVMLFYIILLFVWQIIRELLRLKR